MPDIDIEWEDVVVPQGQFIRWAKVGQTVTGKVVAYSDDGGTRGINDPTPCPQIVIELIEPATNYDKDGQTTTIGVGELVTITASQASASRNLKAAQPAVGDLIKMTYESDYKTAMGTGKAFDVKIARMGGRNVGVDPESL